MVEVDIKGNLIDIDEECVDLVSLFNKIGLDTKFCCSGHGTGTFEIMLEDYVTDKQIEDFLLDNTKNYGNGYVHSWFLGKFQKWCRILSGEIKYNWIYSAYNIEEARKSTKNN